MFLLGKFRQDLADVVNETHVQHTVRFIQYKVLDLVEANEPLLHEVQQTTGCGDQDVDAFSQCLFLRNLRNAAKDHRMTQSEVLTIRFKAFTDLQSQFTRWREHQCMYVGILCRMILGVQQLEDRQGESCRFTGSGLRATKDIVSL